MIYKEYYVFRQLDLYLLTPIELIESCEEEDGRLIIIIC